MNPAIRARREALKLTQKTAAQLAGVTEPTWQRFETGGKRIAPYLAARCMRLLNGEVKIPRGTPRSARRLSARRWRRTRTATRGRKRGRLAGRAARQSQPCRTTWLNSGARVAQRDDDEGREDVHTDPLGPIQDLAGIRRVVLAD